MAAANNAPLDLIEVRASEVHGLGVFARRAIPKGTRLIEYVGERVSHAEADRRYEDKAANDSHTFLFIVDSRTVIDAGVDGNEARFFNHSCDPNCESVVENKRVYIETVRAIEPGAELTYDYQIQREDDDPDDIDEVFACRCGFAACRGTMLWPTERKPKRKARRKQTARGKVEAKTRSKSKAKSSAGKAGATRGKVGAKSKRSDKARGKSERSAGRTQHHSRMAKKAGRRR
jgi:hypothetical protein